MDHNSSLLIIYNNRSSQLSMLIIKLHTIILLVIRGILIVEIKPLIVGILDLYKDLGITNADRLVLINYIIMLDQD